MKPSLGFHWIKMCYFRKRPLHGKLNDDSSALRKSQGQSTTLPAAWFRDENIVNV